LQAGAASPLAEVLKTSGSSDRLNVDAVEAMYDDAIVGEGGLDRVLRRLEVFANGRNRQPLQRANIHLALALVHWRHGNREASLGAVDNALDVHETIDGMLLKARLLDAAGDAEAAVPFYERALAATDREEEAGFIRLRLTMAQARAHKVDVLVELARERDQSFRNRAAIALGILGHPELANEIYRVVGSEGDQPYREHVRLTQWALASGQHALAQRHAWLAFDVAGLQIDARYALALLVESHGAEGSLARLATDLDGRGNRDAWNRDLTDLRVDLLIETQQFDAAIAFYQSQAANAGADLGARQRLLELYDTAGRPDDMVAEYRRLMAAEPHALQWFSSLASHYVGNTRPDDALAVWREFETANADRLQALVEAGERMIGMGFLDEAVDMVERQMAMSGEHGEGLLFLFEAHRERGRDDDALAILDRLDTLLPPGDSAVRDLADAYERMNRPERALGILETLATSQDGLGYNEQTRLAWLYSLADRKQDALDAWRALWVSVDNAARRRLAEDQLLLLAAELGTLGDIVVELEEKVYAGEAGRNEMDLLVRVYAEVGDTLSATEVIDEYARSGGIDPVERLSQLAAVHRVQKDYPAYDKVLRQLIPKDPDNELEHVQNLVLNLLAHDLAEDSDERYGEIRRWLERLRVLDAEGVSGEFEAGVLSLGDFDQEAIESYRRALVENPENSDNLLLMADRMKEAGRRDEAVVMLQYAAEHAVDDTAFVVAVDGIINMIGARSFRDRLTPELRGIFQWTQRVILERITSHDDQFYLYQLLADIAQETEDTEGVFLALENALPQAGIRRPAILRELVTLATPSTGFAGFNTGQGDPERRLVYGRRLIGLGQAMPPEVYINLGKALLEKDDVAGAERAFDRIDDITGLIDVDKTKADLLYDAGYPGRALGHYGRALSVNQDSIGLLARTALLHEVRGHMDVANGLYLRGLGNLLRGEALTRSGRRAMSPRSGMASFSHGPGLDGVSPEYRVYFEFLVQGLLGTWPRGTEMAKERIDAIEAMFDEALEAVLALGDLDDKTVEEFPRLDRTARFVRRLTGTLAIRDLADRIDLALEEPFGKDDEEPGASAIAESSLLQRNLDRARRRGDFREAALLARLMGDETTLVEVLRAQIANGNYDWGLVNAWSLLDRAPFTRLVNPVTSTLEDNASAFLRFLGNRFDLVPAMEEALGRDLLAIADLIELIDQAGGPRGRTIYLGNVWGIWQYVKAKGTVAEQIDFLAAVAAHAPRGHEVASIVADLLAVEIPPEQRIAVVDALRGYLSKQDLASPGGLTGSVQMLLLDIHPANAEVIYALAAFLEERASPDIDLVAVLKDIHEGTPESAFAAFRTLADADLWQPGAGMAGNLDEKVADERERILAAVERGDDVPLATAEFAYRTTFSRYSSSSKSLQRRKAELAPHFAALDPDNRQYHLDRINALLDLGEESAAEEALHDYYRENPGDEFARAGLYFRLLGQGKAGAALAVVTDGGADLRDQAAVDALLDKLTRSGGPSARLLQQFYSGPMPPSPFNHYTPVVQRNIARLREEARAHLDGTGPPKDSGSATGESVTDDEGADGNIGQSIRAALRGSQAPIDDGGRPRFMPGSSSLFALTLDANRVWNPWFHGPSNQAGSISALLATRADGGEKPLLFDVLAGMPGVAEQFERFVPSLPDAERRDDRRLYTVLADALDAAGLTESRLAQLMAQLESGTIGNHEFTLWMTLRYREQEPLSANELDAFRARAAEIEEPTSSELLSLARLFAKGGAHVDAAEHYSLLAATLIEGGAGSRIYPSGFMMSGTVSVMMTVSGGMVYHMSGSGSPAASPLEVLREIGEVLPQKEAVECIRAILGIARTSREDAPSAALFDAAVLKVLANFLPPADALAEAFLVSHTAPTVAVPFEIWHVPQVLELIRLYAGAGNTDNALALLRQFVVENPDDSDPTEDSDDQAQARHAGTANRLAGIFGLRLVRDSSMPLVAGFVHGSERVFPRDVDHAWPGIDHWHHAAVAAMFEWLDDADLDPAAVRDMMFAAAWQLHGAGETDLAGDIVERLGAQLEAKAEVDPEELHNLARLALRVGSPLPPDLAVATVASGKLTAAQEAGLVRELAEAGDVAGALRVGRAADQGGKLELLRELHPIASENDTVYAEDLANRLEVAEAAYRELGTPEFVRRDP